MPSMTLDCYQFLEQAQVQSLRQELHVRCVVVFLGGSMCFVPVKPEVSKRRATQTGYEVCDVEMKLAKEGSVAAAFARLEGTFPEELRDVVYFIGITESATNKRGIDELCHRNNSKWRAPSVRKVAL